MSFVCKQKISDCNYIARLAEVVNNMSDNIRMNTYTDCAGDCNLQSFALFSQTKITECRKYEKFADNNNNFKNDCEYMAKLINIINDMPPSVKPKFTQIIPIKSFRELVDDELYKCTNKIM
jgi:hypothetical protein